MCIQYNEVLLSQARVTAACTALHVVEARSCRWLLQTADRAESNTVALTQEFLAEMLCVRYLGHGASKIQTAGAINHSRGQITILKRSARACCGRAAGVRPPNLSARSPGRRKGNFL
jgi:hypothetical protein